MSAMSISDRVIIILEISAKKTVYVEFKLNKFDCDVFYRNFCLVNQKINLEFNDVLNLEVLFLLVSV